jgi:hypothetical protein
VIESDDCAILGHCLFVAKLVAMQQNIAEGYGDAC